MKIRWTNKEVNRAEIFFFCVCSTENIAEKNKKFQLAKWGNLENQKHLPRLEIMEGEKAAFGVCNVR